jgi:hypothetical protein
MIEWWNNGIMGWRPCETWANKRLRRKEGSWEAMKLGSWGNNSFPDPIALSYHSIIPSFHHSRCGAKQSYVQFLKTLVKSKAIGHLPISIIIFPSLKSSIWLYLLSPS